MKNAPFLFCWRVGRTLQSAEIRVSENPQKHEVCGINNVLRQIRINFGPLGKPIYLISGH